MQSSYSERILPCAEASGFQTDFLCICVVLIISTALMLLFSELDLIFPFAEAFSKH